MPCAHRTQQKPKPLLVFLYLVPRVIEMCLVGICLTRGEARISLKELCDNVNSVQESFILD